MKSIGRIATTAAAVALTSGFAVGAAQAQARGQSRAPLPWAAGVSVGSDGLSAELKYAISPSLVLRVRGAGLDARHSANASNIHYGGRLKFATGGAFLDWHPLNNGLMLSGGVIAGKRELDLSGTPTSSVTINGDTYTAAQLGTVSGKAKLPSTVGFLGVGYDSTFAHNWPIGFNVLAGVQVGDAPKVTLTSTGSLASTPQLQADLVREEAEIRHDVSFAKYYPAISMGLTYRF